MQRVYEIYEFYKCLALANRKNVILLHDNVRPHTASVRQENTYELTLQNLPQQIKLFGKIFKNEEQINQAVGNLLQSKPTMFYKEGMDYY